GARLGGAGLGGAGLGRPGGGGLRLGAGHGAGGGTTGGGSLQAGHPGQFPLAGDDFLELSTGAECGHVGLLDLDGFTGTGIAGGAGRASALFENPETSDVDLLALVDVADDDVHN